MRRLVKAIDARLRRRQGIVPYSNDPECLLRISSGRADADRTLSDGTQIRRGDPICIIHFWNEHMPQIPPKGADIAWALQFRRQLRHSFRLLAQHFQETPAAERVQAITGELSFGSAYRFGRFEAIMERWGFDVVASPEPTQLWSRFVRFWENVYALALAWAYNPGSLAGDRWRLRRDVLWMSRRVLMETYALARTSDHPGELPHPGAAAHRKEA